MEIAAGTVCVHIFPRPQRRRWQDDDGIFFVPIVQGFEACERREESERVSAPGHPKGSLFWATILAE